MLESAADVYLRLQSAYQPREHDQPISAHAAFPWLEFRLRFLSLLSSATIRDAGLPVIKIRGGAGLGELLAFLRKAHEVLKGSESGFCPQLWLLLDLVINKIDQGISGSTEMHTFKRLRDHLSHGGAEPSGIDCRDAVNTLNEKISEAVVATLSRAQVRVDTSHSKTGRPFLIWGDGQIALWPLVAVDQNRRWCLFLKLQSNKQVFLCHENESGIAQFTDDDMAIEFNSLLVPMMTDKTLQRYVDHIRRDLTGFADTDHEPQYSENEDGIVFAWNRATSEGVEPRRDYFRVGPNDVRQWRSESGWVEYNSYLLVLANWRTVAIRIRQNLEKIDARLVEDERLTHHWSARDSHVVQDVTVRVSEFDGSGEESKTFSKLIRDVERDLDTNRGQPMVIFVTGEAGIGKTLALVNAAKERAKQVENSAIGAGERPLFLYVRSTGQVLDSLSTVVGAAVSSTRNLTDEAVRALCRNGLMVLLIDGFDELLGGAGYNDAVGSLRPWLEDLGGRGVVVVSARSSYYLNQYRSSLQRAAGHDPIDVRHRIAEIQRWQRPEIERFVSGYGIRSSAIDELAEHDRQLLELPFFARAFVELSLEHPTADWSARSLPDLLLTQYLLREESKLSANGEFPNLLSQQQLKQIFQQVAELMTQNDEREVAVEDLELAAMLTIGTEDLRPALRQRLTVLCGLALSDDGNSAKRFHFQHELFFDQFLAGAASQYLASKKRVDFRRMLKESHWRTATVTAVVESGVDKLDNILRISTDELLADDGAISPITAANLGALWAGVISRKKRFPSNPIVGASFDNLELANVTCADACLRNCTVGTLVLPSTGPWNLILDCTTVDMLKADNSVNDLSGLRFVGSVDVRQLLLAKELALRPKDIRDRLRKKGATVSLDEDKDVVDLSEGETAAKAFLQRLEQRIQISVVLRESDRQPEADFISWTQEFGSEMWGRFIRNLEESNLVRCVPIAASGKSKVRAKFKISPHEILQNDPKNAKVDKFWRLMSDQ